MPIIKIASDVVSMLIVDSELIYSLQMAPLNDAAAGQLRALLFFFEGAWMEPYIDTE